MVKFQDSGLSGEAGRRGHTPASWPHPRLGGAADPPGASSAPRDTPALPLAGSQHSWAAGIGRALASTQQPGREPLPASWTAVYLALRGGRSGSFYTASRTPPPDLPSAGFALCPVGVAPPESPGVLLAARPACAGPAPLPHPAGPALPCLCLDLSTCLVPAGLGTAFLLCCYLLLGTCPSVNFVLPPARSQPQQGRVGT